MQNKTSLIITGIVLLAGLGVGLVLVLRPSPNPLGSRAGEKPTLLPTLAVGSSNSSPTTVAAKGDFNNDEVVDNADLTLWQGYLEDDNLKGDLNNDGKVDPLDLGELKKLAQH